MEDPIRQRRAATSSSICLKKARSWFLIDILLSSVSQKSTATIFLSSTTIISASLQIDCLFLSALQRLMPYRPIYLPPSDPLRHSFSNVNIALPTVWQRLSPFTNTEIRKARYRDDSTSNVLFIIVTWNWGSQCDTSIQTRVYLWISFIKYYLFGPFGPLWL